VLEASGSWLARGREGWRTLLDFFRVEMGMHCGCARVLVFARGGGAKVGSTVQDRGGGLDRTGTWRC
jgi:hypothetical protein